MRYTQVEKMEVIRLVEESADLPPMFVPVPELVLRPLM